MNNKVSIIGVPYLYGKDNMNKSTAPDVLRNTELFKALEIAKISYEDLGNIHIENKTHISVTENRKFLYLKHIAAILSELKNTVAKTLSKGNIPIVIGGDHSIAIGSLLGQAEHSTDVSVVWIDTHGDFHTSATTPSGRIHGMSLALSIGMDKEFNTFLKVNTFIEKQNTVLFGAHKFDYGEKDLINKHIHLIEMNEIIRYGIGDATEHLLSTIGTKNIHISLDLDAIDKLYAPGTDMAIDGSLTYREILYALEKLSQKHTVVGIDMVEYTPENDIGGKTASLAIEAITTALGSRVGAYELYMESLEKV